ncbi:MAG: DUF1028 domain-containing protein [bacterium]|jgi:uncharacterized Ntn-hydrolase superfamily protein
MDNTFSIVGRCPHTGALGVAIATARIAVGSRAPHARAHVAAISTQAWIDVMLAYKSLQIIEKGQSAQVALEQVLAEDEGKELRQLIIIDAHGNKAAFTGKGTEPFAGHIVGENCVVAGNFLKDKSTLNAMAAAFDGEKGCLGDRLMLALESGQAAGGDKRGKMSAAIIVVKDSIHPYINLRVDYGADPVKELREIYNRYLEFLQGAGASQKSQRLW